MSDVSKTPVTADAAAFTAARGEASPRPETPRLRRETPPRKDQSAKRLVPAASAFDLLDGEYLKNRKSRIISLISLGFAGLLLVLFAAQLFRVRFEIAAEQGRYNDASASGAESKAALDQLSQFEGVPGDIVAESLMQRSAHAAVASESELDLVEIVNEISSIAPQGVQITTITLDPAAMENAKKEAKETNDEAALNAASLSSLVTVMATADSYPAIAPFLEAMRQSPNLNDFKESWSGEPPLLRLRVDIKVRVASSPRYIQFATDAGIIEKESSEGSAEAATAPGEGG